LKEDENFIEQKLNLFPYNISSCFFL